MDAERACLLHGNLRIQALGTENEELAEIREGDRAAYKYIDFGKGVKTVTFRVAPGAEAGTISVCLNDPWGWTAAKVQIPGDGDGKTYTTITVPVSFVTGVHAVWLNFNATENSNYKVDWFIFK